MDSAAQLVCHLGQEAQRTLCCTPFSAILAKRPISGRRPRRCPLCRAAATESGCIHRCQVPAERHQALPHTQAVSTGTQPVAETKNFHSGEATTNVALAIKPGNFDAGSADARVDIQPSQLKRARSTTPRPTKCCQPANVEAARVLADAGADAIETENVHNGDAMINTALATKPGKVDAGSADARVNF